MHIGQCTFVPSDFLPNRGNQNTGHRLREGASLVAKVPCYGLDSGAIALDWSPSYPKSQYDCD